jgi:hypothetical protein
MRLQVSSSKLKLRLHIWYRWWYLSQYPFKNYHTYPANISYINIPNAHQSTALLWPLLCIISGARYSGVPHNVHVLKNNWKGYTELLQVQTVQSLFQFPKWLLMPGWHGGRVLFAQKMLQWHCKEKTSGMSGSQAQTQTFSLRGVSTNSEGVKGEPLGPQNQKALGRSHGRQLI